MANAGEVLDSLRELRAKNREDHKSITDRLDVMNGTQREHGLKIQALESTAVTHEGRIDLAKTERDNLKISIKNLTTSKKQLALIVGGAVTVTVALLQYVVMPLLQHIFGHGGP